MTMGYEKLLAEAAALRLAREDDYDAVKDRVLARVRRWEWDALGTWREIPVPHWAELHELPPKRSRPRDKPPKRLSHGVEYGLDDEQNVIAARNYMSGTEVTDERFLERSGDRRELSAYRRQWPGGRPGPAYAAIGRFDGERLCEWASSTSDAVFEAMQLHYDGDRVSHVDVVSREPGDETERYLLELVYGKDGELARVRTQAAEVNQAPNQDLSLSAVPERLADLLAAAAGRTAPNEPVFALVLLYDYAVLLPPIFGFITSRAATAAQQRGAPPEFWNPAEHVLVDGASDEMRAELGDVLRAANAELREADDDEPLRDVVIATVRLVQSMPLPQRLVRDHDFVITAVDSDLRDVERNLVELLDDARFEALRARKLV